MRAAIRVLGQPGVLGAFATADLERVREAVADELSLRSARERDAFLRGALGDELAELVMDRWAHGRALWKGEPVRMTFRRARARKPPAEHCLGNVCEPDGGAEGHVSLWSFCGARLTLPYEQAAEVLREGLRPAHAPMDGTCRRCLS